jgi:ATP-dependent Zn protease
MTANDCERAAMTACEIDSMLKVLLAGRAAEQVILGEVSTGAGGTAQSDLAKATLLATTAAANFGFSPTIGLNWLGDVNPDTFTHILVLNPALAKDVSATLGRTYENVVARIMERGAVVRRVAELLVESETVEGPDIEALVASEKVNRVRDDTERGREKRRGRRAVLT